MENEQTTQHQGVTAKQAAQAAAHYLRDVAGLSGPFSVEEVELEGGYWRITLGYDENRILGYGNKTYKVFKVDAQTGEVDSMKIWGSRT